MSVLPLCRVSKLVFVITGLAHYWHIGLNKGTLINQTISNKFLIINKFNAYFIEQCLKVRLHRRFGLAISLSDVISIFQFSLKSQLPVRNIVF